MDNVYQRLIYLFEAYLNKTASEEEKTELFILIDTAQADEHLLLLLKTAWADTADVDAVFTGIKADAVIDRILSDHHFETTITKDKILRKRINYKILSAAALLLVCLGFAMFLGKQKQQSKKVFAVKNRPVYDALPGGNKAILKLANGKIIVLDTQSKGAVASIGGTQIRKANNGLLVLRAESLTTNSAADLVNTITTPRGGQYQILLTDGTKVWLNAASSLSFPIRFTGNSRKVMLTGEGYFEVFKNPASPFKVQTDLAEITVLGTHFNIMAYKNEQSMQTTLLQGKVNVLYNHHINLLTPGKQAVITPGKQALIINNVDVDDAVAWTKGIFQFTDIGVDQIMRQAARWYDIDVKYEGKPSEKKFTGHISRDVKASSLFNMLRYAGVNIHTEGKTAIISDF